MCGICFTVRQRILRRRLSEHRCAAQTEFGGGELPAQFVTAPCAECRAILQVQGWDQDTSENSSLFHKLLEYLRRRGPDSFGHIECSLPTVIPGETELGGVEVLETEVHGFGSVLGLRGSATVRQPYEIHVETDVEEEEGHRNTSFLLWNGEIFRGKLCPPAFGSDTAVLATGLSQWEHDCARQPIPFADRQRRFLHHCVEMMESEVEGPYGLIYFACQLNMVVFARDPLGRRSLLLHRSERPVASTEEGDVFDVEWMISSVGVEHATLFSAPSAVEPSMDAEEPRKKRPRPGPDAAAEEREEEAGETATGEEASTCWEEVPVTGVFALYLQSPITCGTCAVGHVAWMNSHHLLHPLLRAEVGSDSSSVGSPVDAAPPLPTPPSAPPEELKVPDDLLRLICSSVAESDSEEARWAHWGAVVYGCALADSVFRRLNASNTGADDYSNALTASSARQRPICVPFSGGIDCTTIAALAHYLLPIETPIELVNVVFGDHPEQAPDRVAALRSVEELLQLPQPTPELGLEREWRLVFVDVPTNANPRSGRIVDLLTPRHTVMDWTIGTALWHAAQGEGRMQVLRASDAPAPTSQSDMVGDCPEGPSSSHSPTLSGYSKHVRLYDGAEVQPPTVFPQSPDAAPGTTPPEEERFSILVDVLVTEGQSGGGPTQPVLLSLLGKEYGQYLGPQYKRHGYKKLGSYLNDASRAGVIEFVSGTGTAKSVRLLREEDRQRAETVTCPWYTTVGMRERRERTPPDGSFRDCYRSESKVLLLGMGADETLGGYQRYRNVFRREKMAGTRLELDRDFRRLWQRNLGRDDRITMDSGREGRFPYLDENVLRTLQHIVRVRRAALLREAAAQPHQSHVLDQDTLLQKSIEPVLNLELNAGAGDKLILRHCARILGLSAVTRLQKRAIQFGSRSADRRTKGSDAL